MAVTLTQLTSFLALVRHGSVTAAAEELVVTQPSVSAAIGALERELGVKLTERAGRALRPTAAGVAYAAYARDVLGLLAQGARAAREATDAHARTLRISAVTTAGERLAPPLIRDFWAAHPDLEITLHVGNREDVFRRLVEHEVDVAITGRPPKGASLQARPIVDHRYVLVTAKGDPLARRPWVAVEELAGRSWLLREPGSGTRRLCEEFLASHKLRPQILTLGSNGAIVQAARAGLGVALQSLTAVALEVDHGMLETIRPRGGLPRRTWYVVRSGVGPLRPEVDRFIAFVASTAGRQSLARTTSPPAR